VTEGFTVFGVSPARSWMCMEKPLCRKLTAG
jgi:hypothetical protein